MALNLYMTNHVIRQRRTPLPRRPLPAAPNPSPAPDRVDTTGVSEATRKLLQVVNDQRPTSETPPEQVQAWKKQLLLAQLELTREISAVAHADRIPPEAANQVFAKLVKGSALLLSASGEEFTPPPLSLAVLGGQAHNRWRHHLEVIDTEPPPLDLRDSCVMNGQLVLQKDKDEHGEETERALVVRASNFLLRHSPYTMPHEFEHVRQGEKQVRGDDAYHDADSLLNLGNRNRVGLSQVARGLPHVHVQLRPGERLSKEVKEAVYHAKPREIEAYQEQSVPLALSVDDIGRSDTGEAGPVSSRLPQEIRFIAGALEKTVDKLVSDALNFGKMLEMVAAMVLPNLWPEGIKVAGLDFDKHPRAAEHLETIVLATADIHEAADSQAWNTGEANSLRVALRDIHAAVPNGGAGAETAPTALQALEIMASRLTRFRDDLIARKGDELHIPKGVALPTSAAKKQELLSAERAEASLRWFERDVDPLSGTLSAVLHLPAQQASRFEPNFAPNDAFGHLKASPIDAVREAVTSSMPAEERRLHGEFDTAQFKKSIESKKQSVGFKQAVKKLSIEVASGRLDKSEIGTVVGRLAVALTGVKDKEIPPILIPAVNVFNASRTIDVASGLNTAPGQKRKALFEKFSWQLHIPRHVLDDPHRLENRLAGLAECVAADIAALMVGNGRKPQSGDLFHGVTSGALALVEEAALELKADADRSIASGHRDDIAAVLRREVERDPTGKMDRAWHEGPRADVKARAKGSGPDAVMATVAYEARTHLRHKLPRVALHRAVKETPQSDVDATGATDPSGSGART